VDFVPVHLRQLVEPPPDGGKPAKMGPRKKAHYYGDLLGWAELIGVELTDRARDLMKTDARPALRAALAARELGGAEAFSRFHHAAYRARWCDGRDLSQAEPLAALLDAAGLDAGKALDLSDSDGIVATLERNTEDAIERGVFGVPTMLVGDKLFWGNDRFELVRFYLQKALPRGGAS